MRIAYKNLIDAVAPSTALIASSNVLPIVNIQDQRLSIKWKSDTATSQTVVIDLDPISTALTSINTIGVLGHNIVSGTSVIVEANATNSWGAPSFSTTMTVIEDGAILKFLSSLQLYRYWRFSFSGQSELTVGRLWLGEYVQINPSSQVGFTVTKLRSDNVTHNRGRQKFASIGVGWRRFDMDFPPSDEASIQKIDALFDYVGIHSSFIFCNFDSLRDYILVEPCYVSIVDPELEFTHNRGMRFNYSLSLEEEL